MFLCAMQSSRNQEFKKIPTQVSHLYKKVPHRMIKSMKEYDRELTVKYMANDLDKDLSKNNLFQESV